MSSSESSEESVQYDFNEEEALQEGLAEVELGKIVAAKSKLNFKQKATTEKVNKKTTREKYEMVNKTKSKDEPKEFSALIRPKTNQLNTKEEKRFFRDPRFDDLSGDFKSSSFKKNFSFVDELADEYVDKIKKYKTKKNISETEYELLKKQTNYVKGWQKNQQKVKTKDEIKTEMNRENKSRMQKGKTPIYLKKKVLKTLVQKEESEKREQNPSEFGKFLKRKKHKEMVNARKNEIGKITKAF